MAAAAAAPGWYPDEGVTSRFLLPDLADSLTEAQLLQYFIALGEIEEVNIKQFAGGKRMGSVKFSNPTAELRNLMLKGSHVIEGIPVTVMTWKMQKLQKPGYHAKKAAEAAFKGMSEMYTRSMLLPGGDSGSSNGPSFPSIGSRSGPYGAMYKKGGSGDAELATAGYGPAAAGYGPSRGSHGKGADDPWSGWGPMWAKGFGPWGPPPSVFMRNMGYGPPPGFPWWMMPMPGCGKGAVAPPAWAGKAASLRQRPPGPPFDAGGKKFYEDTEATSRFLLSNIAEGTSEETIREYFAVFGEIEEVTLKQLGSSGALVGSVKFRAPTMDLKRLMIKETHEINGQQLIIETWKMRKNGRPPGGAATKALSSSAAASSLSRVGMAQDAAGADGLAADMQGLHEAAFSQPALAEVDSPESAMPHMMNWQAFAAYQQAYATQASAHGWA